MFFAVLAAVLIILDKIFFVISIGLIVVGAILAIIIMFLIIITIRIIISRVKGTKIISKMLSRAISLSSRVEINKIISKRTTHKSLSSKSNHSRLIKAQFQLCIILLSVKNMVLL